MKKCLMLTSALLLAVSAHASAEYVQRTMKKMSESTLENPATVRMLFYGQSIVEQGWSEELVACLRKRYPTVRFAVENKAIGGFESPLLIRAAEADLYPAYADIVFFQDYGPTELVRTMIERLRARTTSEIVMWTSHVHRKEAAEASLEELAREEDARSKDLVSIAADNHCLFVHLRRAWCEKLLANGWTADHYLKKDGTHLDRDSGAFDLYAETIAAELVRIDGAEPDAASGTITDYPCKWTLEGDGYVKNADGSVDFAFTGNRVEMLFRPRCCYGTSPFTVLLDGKPLSSCKELYHHGRVSNLISWMPLVLHVGAESLPLAETWKLTFLEGTSPDGKPIRYRVDGSRTGFDGEGRSDRDFVSNSGRVTIKASDFHLWQYGYFVGTKKIAGLDAKPGQWITWDTVADFQETFSGYQPADRPVLVLSGCANGKHKLTFVPSVPARLPVVEKLTVYRPSGKDVGETPAEKSAASKRAPVNPDFNPDRVDGGTSGKEAAHGFMATYAAPKLDRVRVAFVGVGSRGGAAVRRLAGIPGVEVTGLCDIESNAVAVCQTELAQLGKNTAETFVGPEAWKDCCRMANADVVYICTHWEMHVPPALLAMECGKHAMVEVPAAMTLEDCWRLVDTSERTRRHCMMLENACYTEVELFMMSVVNRGLIGEPIYAEGGYVHDQRNTQFTKRWNNWRIRWNRNHSGDQYPTHGLGPCAMCLGINRGDRMTSLVSLGTDQFGMEAWAKANLPEGHEFRDMKIDMPDCTVTLIRTAKGKMILLKHDVTNPQPKTEVDFVSGLKGAVGDFPPRLMIDASDKKHAWMPEEELRKAMDEYMHPLWKTAGKVAEKMGGHGGCDFLMDFRWVYCLRNGLPLDMNVYDLAAWSSICELSDRSCRANGMPQDIPDFTRGAWRTTAPLGLVDIDLSKTDLGAARGDAANQYKE